jgi:hypothetical protein
MATQKKSLISGNSAGKSAKVAKAGGAKVTGEKVASLRNIHAKKGISSRRLSTNNNSNLL